MTVPVQTPLVAYTGNGIATVFTFPFRIIDEADLKVEVAGAVVSGYTITGLGADEGTATFSTPPALGVQVILYRQVALERDTDYQNNGDFTSAVVNADFDRIWMALQDVDDVGGRAIRYPVEEFGTDGTLPPPTDRANALIGFDANGKQIMVPNPASIGAGDLRVEEWTDGVDYVSGTSTSVQLSREYGTKANLGSVVMQGVAQDPDSYQLFDRTLIFDDVIPLGIPKIWCMGGTTLSQISPGDLEANVVSFGADPTGIKDSTAAFRAAIATGKTVVAPEGTFCMQQVVWPDKSRFKGKGFRTIIKPVLGFAVNAFWVTESGASNVNLGHFSMNLPVVMFANTVPIYIQQGSNNHIHDIYMPEGGNIGLVLVDNVDTVVDQVTVLAANVYCLHSNGTASARNKFINCHAGTTLQSHGISIVDGIDHNVTNCISEGASGFGISYFRVVGGQATDNRCGNTKVEGMQITDSSYVTYANNNIRWDAPTVSHDFGISLAAQTPGLFSIGNKIINNLITGNGASGIGVASTNFGPLNDAPVPGPGLPVQDNDISGNTIINCSLNTVAGGGLVNGYGAGILLYGSGCQDNSVSNNIILNNVGTMLYAVAEFNVSDAWGPPAGNKIFSNKCIGFTTAAVLNVGNSVVSLTSGVLAYAAALGAVSGALTAANVITAFYYETETVYDVTIQIHITTNGSAAGGITFALPRSAQIGFGCGHNSGGGILGVTCSGTTATIRNSDGTHPGADGQTLEVMCRFFR